MFISNPEEVILALISIVDKSNSRISLSKAIKELKDQGFDLGTTPQESLRALVSLVDPNVLNLRQGRGGGIGRPIQSSNKFPIQKTNSGLVTLMRQALMEGKTIEDLRKQLSNYSDTE